MGNRLVEVAYPGRSGITDTEYLCYDKAGNRTERIRRAVHEQYLYDECNRLLQITDGADTVKNYTYDNSGNMLSDGEMSYFYDGFGRLEQVKRQTEASRRTIMTQRDCVQRWRKTDNW